MDAVFDQDPQRVCILQGPVAVKHAKVANVPIKNMLGGVQDALIKKLLDRYYGGDESRIPTIDYIGASPANPTLADAYEIEVTSTKDAITYKIGSFVPPTEE